MPLIPAGFAEATLVFNVDGVLRDMTTSFGIDPAATPDSTPEQLGEDVYGAATGAGSIVVAAAMGEEWTFQGVAVTKQLEDGPITGQFFDAVTGTVTSDGLICNTALLVTKQTSAGGRRNRGRCYCPPHQVAEVNVNAAGVIDSAARTVYQSAWNVFYLALATLELPVVLFHSEAPFTPTPVTGFSVGSLCATQRRRMRG